MQTRCGISDRFDKSAEKCVTLTQIEKAILNPKSKIQNPKFT
ncbi:MAG: hypothetical protein RMY28_022800 [Nostoc sp. ChiSLP01]